MTTPEVEVTYDDVMASVEAVKRGLQETAALLLWQIENQVWLVTGHADWDEFRNAYYGIVAVILPTDDRKELVPKLRLTGMTQQQIADTLGVSQYTIHKDLNIETNNEVQPVTITNARGQERPATYQRRALTPVEDTEDGPQQQTEGLLAIRPDGSRCFLDPSEGAAGMKDLLRGADEALRNYYTYPTEPSLDVLDAWLARQQKKSEKARSNLHE
jgi:hypothetical protein